MKTGIVILSYYILALSLLPCAETVDGYFFSAQAEVIAANQSSDEDIPLHDHCTPFCICDCCGISLTKPDITSVISEITPPVSRDIPVYRSNLLATPALQSIWQPPKFS